MRIIAGEFGGRKLLGPDGESTRPITDRAKQSLFDVITPLIPGARIYDCFCGTGSLGLEALSRGASHVTFFEIDRNAIAKLNQNIMALRVAERTRIVPGDVFRWLNLGSQRPEAAGVEPVDLLFLDPPYRFLTERPDELLQLALHMTAQHLKANATVIFRHDAPDTLELPRLRRYDQREFGDMIIEFLRVEEQAADPDALP